MFNRQIWTCLMDRRDSTPVKTAVTQTHNLQLYFRLLSFTEIASYACHRSTDMLQCVLFACLLFNYASNMVYHIHYYW